MRQLRGSVFFAWVACIVAGTGSVISLTDLLRQPGNFPWSIQLVSTGLFELVPPVFAIPGALIVSRHPRHVIGWLLLAPALFFGMSQWMIHYLNGFGGAAPPATLPHLLMIWFAGSNWLPMIFAMLLLPLLFPTGRPPTPRWRWVLYLAAGMSGFFLFFWAPGMRTIRPEFATWTIENPIGFLPDTADQAFLPVWSVLMLVLMAASLASTVVRFRRASAVEREQMKWLLYAVTIWGLVYSPSALIGGSQNLSQPLASIYDILFALAGTTIPIAIAIAILRYHLFDIDVIIRQTMVYALVTGMLGLGYLGGVLVLQEVFRSLTGQNSGVAVGITTLAIAALFNPLRRRSQAIINRRFFRQKYNAEQALAEFALAARNGSDLDDLTAMLVGITQKTLQPTDVTLYLKPGKEESYR